MIGSKSVMQGYNVNLLDQEVAKEEEASPTGAVAVMPSAPYMTGAAAIMPSAPFMTGAAAVMQAEPYMAGASAVMPSAPYMAGASAVMQAAPFMTGAAAVIPAASGIMAGAAAVILAASGIMTGTATVIPAASVMIGAPSIIISEPKRPIRGISMGVGSYTFGKSIVGPPYAEYINLTVAVVAPRKDLQARRLLALQFIDGLLKDKIRLDEPTLQRFVYIRNKKVKEDAHLEPLYEDFVRTQFGPFNEELWTDVRQLKDQGMVDVDKCILRLTRQAEQILIGEPIDESLKYWGEREFKLDQVYPLKEMLQVDIGSALP